MLINSVIQIYPVRCVCTVGSTVYIFGSPKVIFPPHTLIPVSVVVVLTVEGAVRAAAAAVAPVVAVTVQEVTRTPALAEAGPGRRGKPVGALPWEKGVESRSKGGSGAKIMIVSLEKTTLE